MTDVFVPGLFMFPSHIQSIREYLWTACKKVVKSKLNNSGFNSLELTIYQGPTNFQSQMFSQPCK